MSSTWSARCAFFCGANCPAHLLGLPDREARLSDPELVLRLCSSARRPEHFAVELLRALSVTRRNRDEVQLLDPGQPTEPSIWSWISRFISTAYSSGSSFVIGSTKPETISAEASASERPRDIR